jgi:hypothetical protein
MLAEVSLINALCVIELTAMISRAAVGMMNLTELSAMISGAAVGMMNVTELSAMISGAAVGMMNVTELSAMISGAALGMGKVTELSAGPTTTHSTHTHTHLCVTPRLSVPHFHHRQQQDTVATPLLTLGRSSAKTYVRRKFPKNQPAGPTTTNSTATTTLQR